MIRRGTGRTPPYILVGLILVIIILGFNYWTLSSQNADLSQELEKLQSEIKISAMKQEQSEKKNSALQETVHEMDGLSNRLKKEIQDDKDALKASNIEVQKLRYEITTLKNKVAKMQEQISSLNQQAEDCEVDLSKAKETNAHLTQERDDAVEAIAEKDSMINSLKRQLEQEKSKSSMMQFSVDDLQKKLSQTFSDLAESQDKVSQLEATLHGLEIEKHKEKARSDAFDISVKDLTLKLTEANKELTNCRESLKTSALENAAELKKAQDEAAAARREKMAIAKPKIEPGMMNIPDIEHKAPQNNNNINGENFNGGVLAPPQSIGQVNLPHDVDDNADHHLAVPGVPPVMERPGAPGEGNKPIQAPIHPGGVDGLGPQNDVLAPPPQHLQDGNTNESKEKIDLDLQKDENGVLGNDGESGSDNIAKEDVSANMIKEERMERDIKKNEEVNGFV